MERLIPAVGERIQRYELIEEIGRGGFGVVYRARQAGLDVDVALKLLIPQFENDEQKEQMLARFEQEARLSKELDHPAAIRVRDYGRTSEGWPFIVSELIKGRDLTELIYREGLDTGRIVRIMAQVLGCLAEAHHLGIVHRDLKPGNIMVRDVYGERDVVKVLDFGIAKAPGQLAGVKTRTGAILGTAHYMSPEQCRGVLDIDGRSDLYAVGLIMAECIGRRRLVDGPDQLGLLYQHARPDPHLFTPLMQASPLFPVVFRATVKERDYRYPDAIAMRAELLALGGVTPSAEHAIPPPQPPRTGPDGWVPSLPTPAPSSRQAHADPSVSSASDPSLPSAGQGRASSRRLALWAAIAATAVAAAVAFAVVSAQRGPAGPEAPPPSPPAAALTSPSPVTRPSEPSLEPAAPAVPQPSVVPSPVTATDAPGGPAGEESHPTAMAEPSEMAAEAGQEPSEGEPAIAPRAGEEATASAEDEAEQGLDGSALAPGLASASADEAADTVVAHFEGSPADARVRVGHEDVCPSLPCDVRLERGEGDERVRVHAAGYETQRIRVSRQAPDFYVIHLTPSRPAPEATEEAERPSLPQVPVFAPEEP